MFYCHPSHIYIFFQKLSYTFIVILIPNETYVKSLVKKIIINIYFLKSMKPKQLLLAGITSIMLFSCSDKEDISGSQDEIKSLSVSLSGIKTRASSPSDIITSDIKNVNSVLIYLTDTGGKIITSKSIAKDETLNSDWNNLTDSSKGLKFINIPQSVSKVYIYGNPENAVNNNVISTKLAEQQGSAVLYYGMDDDLKPIEDEPLPPTPTSGKTYTAQITIAPIVARMQITKISFKNSGNFNFTRNINGVDKKATVSWTGFTGNVKGVYMNNFYNTFNQPGTLADLLLNYTFQGHISNGMWTFDTNPIVDAAPFASYNLYNSTDGTYGNLPLELSGKCYAFNFFPGTAMPQLHLDLADLNIEGLASTDTEVFNPKLANSARFANLVKYYKEINTEMTASDFKPGTLYNMEIELIPMLDNDLGNVQYNVLVHVTIAPWNEETITPDFDLQQ